jgi:hypothetical protein
MTEEEKMNKVEQKLKNKAQKCLGCLLCIRAREKQKGIAYWFAKYIDRKICPYCKAFEKYTGQLAYEPLSKETLAKFNK